MSTRYCTEILKVRNLSTGKMRYYICKCDFMERVKKSDYDEVRNNCYGVSCLFDQSTKTVRRSFTTCIFYI